MEGSSEVWLQLNVEIYADPSRQRDQRVLRGSSMRGDESSGCGKYVGGGRYVEWREWVTPIHSLTLDPKADTWPFTQGLLILTPKSFFTQ